MSFFTTIDIVNLDASVFTLAPNQAFDYISRHNICCVSIGMVTTEEAKLSTEIALKFLQT